MSDCRIVNGQRRAIEILVSSAFNGCFLRRGTLSTAKLTSTLRGDAHPHLAAFKSQEQEPEVKNALPYRALHVRRPCGKPPTCRSSALQPLLPQPQFSRGGCVLGLSHREALQFVEVECLHLLLGGLS
jgi:hypothetical protein